MATIVILKPSNNFITFIGNEMSNFQSLEVVGCCSETQVQVGENSDKLTWHDKCSPTKLSNLNLQK